MEEQQLQHELMETLRRIRCMRPGNEQVPEGLTAGESLALTNIAASRKHAGYARPGMIAAHMHVTKSAFSQTLKALEEKGLVLRAKDASDSRAVNLELTDEGQELVSQFCKRRNEFMKGMFEYIGEEDILHCIRVAKKILEYQESQGFESACEQGDAPCV